MAALRPDNALASLPDPGRARTLDEFAEELRSLKVWAGDPSYDTIKDRINAAWTAAGRPSDELARKATVADCFRSGRRRLNIDLVVEIVQALHPDAGYVAQWRQALRVIGGKTRAASQVRAQDALPARLPEFTGRATELRRLRELSQLGGTGGTTVVISAIAGMAGVGKTQLAVHAGHLLADQNSYEQVLFVNLRGFHPDPIQPPADPAAVLDSFLRLLGVPGEQIPPDTRARIAEYHRRLSGRRVLVLLDNAADEEQVQPLLPDSPGSITLITSRRSLAGLRSVIRLPLDVFKPEEALGFLNRTAPDVPMGGDPRALERIAERCGQLPLALSLVAAHARTTAGWTLTDHADRLDQRHRDRRLETGVEDALDLSYEHLSPDRQRLFRLLALHPGNDFDAYAAAALADTDPGTAGQHLGHLRGDHLLLPATPGRYAFHDLVRAYAADRGIDADRSSERRAALTRLFDYYLAAALAAVSVLYPARASQLPSVPPPPGPIPAMTDPDTALAWLDIERPILIAVAGHTASHGWPAHTTRLSTILFRYFHGRHSTDALTVHGHARQAARDTADQIGEAHALTNLGVACTGLGRSWSAIEYFQQALPLFRLAGDRIGQARTLINLGNINQRLGRYQPATERLQEALALYRESGDHEGEASALGSLGVIEERLGRYPQAAEHLRQALALCRRSGDLDGEAWMLNSLGDVEGRLGLFESATEHLQQALSLFRQLGSRNDEAWTMDTIGMVLTCLNRPGEAIERHREALAIFRETGDQDGEAYTLNGLGEAADVAGHADDAVTHHAAAHALALHTGARDEQARAHAGLGRAYHTLGNTERGRQSYQQALSLFTELGMPQADQVRDRLAALDGWADDRLDDEESATTSRG
jgi:tetratricopeptide (TPR) repeat protein